MISFHTVDEALEDLRRGRVIIVVDDEDRENEGDFVALAEFATPEVINFMVTHGRGLVCAPITEERARGLELPLMVSEGDNTDHHGTAFTVSIDHISCTTGIAAHERSATIQALIHSGARAEDFRRPGHVFPLIARKGGVLRRPGHTEAAVDLARLAGSYPAGVICEVMNDDGTMARVPELKKIADTHGLKIMTIQDLIDYRKRNDNLVWREVTIDLPTAHGHFRAIAYRNEVDDKEHIALVMGDIESHEPVLTRIHSECLTGDVFGSLRCDCGPQLETALEKISAEGTGILVYMRQEGRGIGLMNKLKAYKLQEQGLDTVEANEHLGFLPDLRDYSIGAHILRDIGAHRLRLLTNNPSKIESMTRYGLEVVDVLPLEVEANPSNLNYLKTKKNKLGHALSVQEAR